MIQIEDLPTFAHILHIWAHVLISMTCVFDCPVELVGRSLVEVEDVEVMCSKVGHVFGLCRDVQSHICG